jgi:HEAT repeat protein
MSAPTIGDVPALFAKLRDPNNFEREEAAQALARLGWSPANATERAVLAVATGRWDEASRLGEPALEPLINALGFRDGQQGFGKRPRPSAAEAATALRQLNDPRAIPPLVKTLAEWDPRVRSAAFQTLALMDWKPSTPWERARYLAEAGILQLTHKSDRQSEEEVVARLTEAIDKLIVARAPSVGPLAEALLESSVFLRVEEDVRKEHEAALRWVERTLQSLVAAAASAVQQVARTHANDEVRFRATQLLAEAKDPHAVKELARREEASRGPEGNLQRWRESGWPRQWVAARRGVWNHDDWVALLAELERSEFWPLDPSAVGAVLEETKRQWHAAPW